LARAFADALGRPVRVETVERKSWEALFLSQGMKRPLPRMRMLDGFNEGWIDFHDADRLTVKGSTPLADVIVALIAGSGNLPNP
jgi:hypothetical protein